MRTEVHTTAFYPLNPIRCKRSLPGQSPSCSAPCAPTHHPAQRPLCRGSLSTSTAMPRPVPTAFTDAKKFETGCLMLVAYQRVVSTRCARTKGELAVESVPKQLSFSPDPYRLGFGCFQMHGGFRRFFTYLSKRFVDRSEMSRRLSI